MDRDRHPEYLTGTSDAAHMREDLQSAEFVLSAADLEVVENVSPLHLR